MVNKDKKNKNIGPNSLFDLMMATEIKTEKEERETGNPLKMHLSDIRDAVKTMKKTGLL